MSESGSFSDADGIEGLRKDLDHWRCMHGGRGVRVPEEFWTAAIATARSVGPERFAWAMRLTVESVRSRLHLCPEWPDGLPRARAKSPLGPKPAPFIEMPSMAAPSLSGCTVEMAAPSGARLALRFDDARAIDFRALLHAVMEGVG